MSEVKQISVDQIGVGDIITFQAQALRNGVPEDVTYTAMVYNDKYGPGDKHLGFEVLILAPPGTFRGALGGQAAIIDNPKVLALMGLSGPQRLHFNPVTVLNERFPDLYAHVFRGAVPKTTPAPFVLGSIRGHNVLNKIMDSAQQLDQAGDIRILSLEQLEKTELAPTVPSPVPDAPRAFKKATYDITLENAVKVGLIDAFLANKLSSPDHIISKEKQIKAGIISDNEEPVGPITTIRQLERILEEDETKLRAFIGFSKMGSMYQNALAESKDAVKGFNAAAEGETIRKSPYKELVYEISPEGP